MTRRRALPLLAASTSLAAREPEKLLLTRNGWMPNNDKLPVLLFRGVLSGPNLTERLEAFLRDHAWQPEWRNGVYPFHHYHSTAHEVLAFSRGHARILLGGEGGTEIRVAPGDLAVLPCGTGHCRIDASGDFLVIGAYGLGQSWDLLRAAPDAAAVERMRRLPFPKSQLVKDWNY